MAERILPSRTRSRARRWLKRISWILGGAFLGYAGFLLLGFVPINNGYAPPLEDDRVTLYIRTNEVHTDIVMPVVHEELGVDWREVFPPKHFQANVRNDKYVAVGWGNRDFFVETPTWADFKISTAAKALFTPSESVLHVDYLYDVAPGEYFRQVSISREKYRELVEFVRSTIGETDEHGAAKIATEVTYGASDRFYLARGRYHLFNTCNQWTGRGLARAGVRVGVWTPLKPHVLCWLPKEAA